MGHSDKAPTKVEALPTISQEILAETIAPAGSAPAAPLSDDETIARLAALSPSEYDRVRREEAKAFRIQVKTLDDMVKAARNEDGECIRLPFPEVEPHPEPIDPALVLDELAEIIQRYVVLEKEQADTVALWSALTYFIDVVDISPLLILNAPERECAKTLLQTLVGRVCYRPLPAANASSSALFRGAEVWRPTILIDEADTFFRDNAELRGMVNAGYKRGGFVLRSEAVGDSFEPRMFSVYCAKSIAGIALEKPLPDSTMSRGIVINMRRKLPHEKVQRMRHADGGLFERVAAKLARFAEDYSRQVRLARPLLPDELSDRAQDNWDPLLAIAGCAGPEWTKRATAAALKLSSASEQSVSTGNELLADIQHVFERKRVPKISTADLIQALVADNEKSWATYNHGKPISPRQLAKLLAGYGIKSKTVRTSPTNTPKGFDTSQFEDAFARYLATPPNAPPQRNGPPEAMTGKEGGVADKAQHASHDPLGSVADDFQCFRDASEMLDAAPTLDCGDVADEPERGPEAGTTDGF